MIQCLLNNKDYDIMIDADFFFFLKGIVMSVHSGILGFIVLYSRLDLCKLPRESRVMNTRNMRESSESF